MGAYRKFKDTLEPLRPVYDAWMRVIAGFSWVMARVVLILLFVTLFTLYGIVLRLIRKDPMRRQLDDRNSYWGTNTVTNDDLDDFGNQY